MSPASEQLERRVSGVRGHLRLRAALGTGLWIAGGVGLLLVVAWIAAGPEGWRQGSNIPAIVDALIVVWVLCGVVLHRRGSARSFEEAPLAQSMERAVGLKPGILRGSLELSRSVPEGVSSTLANRAVLRTVMDLEGHQRSALAGELGGRVTRWTRRGLGFAAALAVTLTALFVAAPERTARALAGVASPVATARDPVLLPIVVTPGDVEVMRGTDVQIAIEAVGRYEVVMAWQAAGEVARTATLPVDGGRAFHVFPSVGATIEYSVRGVEGFETPTYRVVPIDPLFVSDMVVGVLYPPHTGLEPDEYRGDPPPLRLPVGSTVTFEGSASRPLSTVELLDSSGVRALGLAVEGAAFSGAWRPTRDGSFDWSFRDQAGAQAEIQPEPLEVTMVPDSAPLVAIPEPGRDTILPLNLRQPLVLQAQDDYGLSRMELVAWRITAFGERLEPVVQGLDLAGTRAAIARPVLDLSTWGLLPGDTVRYYARAVDNSPAGQAANTREYVLRMPAAAELRREAEDALEGVAERLEELAAEAARQAEENRDRALESAARQGDRNETPAEQFEQSEELRNALENQETLTSEVDSLRTELEALERLMEEAGQADPQLREQLEELQDLLREMNSEELRQRMDELSEALDQQDVERANEQLEQMAAEQERFREALEESLERFKRAAVEQDFRATTSEAEELARQEQALADAMREEDNPELRAEQQQQLTERAEQLESRMERLEQRLGELGEERAAEGVQRAQEQVEQSRQQMQEAQEQASRGENREGGERAQQAAEQMEAAAQQLEEAQQQMAQQEMEQQVEALRRTADDALALARRQSELGERMRGASQEQLARLRSEEASLMRGMENIAQNLQQASDGNAGGNQELSAQMGRTMESMENTLAAMENRRGTTPSPSAQAESVVGDLNQLALMAIAGADQMGQQGQGQSGEEVGEQLEQLAQQQGELMNQSGQIMPMQLGQQAMAQQMQQLSQGQESVASDLGELANQPGSEETLGSLEELAREAALLARELGQGRLTPEMMQRQERLFHRLLDAGRSLEREEFSEERESEAPGAFERGSVVPLTAEQLGAMPYGMPDGQQLQTLTPALRQLVLEYFQRLNRGARPGGGS